MCADVNGVYSTEGFCVRARKHAVKPSVQSSDSNLFWQHLFFIGYCESA